MEKELNEEEDFWDWKANQEKNPHFEVKSKKDEFNINNKRDEINNNKQEHLKPQSLDRIESDEKWNGGDSRSVRIEKLIKSLDKLKPTHHDRNQISEGQKSNALPVDNDRRFDSSPNENHINSVGDDHSENGKNDSTTDSDGSGSDRETHAPVSKDQKHKTDLRSDDADLKGHKTDSYKTGVGHHKGDEETVSSQDNLSQRSNKSDEAKSLNGYETFVDYGLPDEGSQLKGDSSVAADDSFMAHDDSEEKTFIVHPPKSGAARRSRRRARKPAATVENSKGSQHRSKGQDLANQRPIQENDNQGESCDESQSPKRSQQAESPGKEKMCTPKAAQKHGSRIRRARRTRSSSPEELGKDGTEGEMEGSRSPPRMWKELRSGDYDWSLSGNEEVREWMKRKNQIARKQKAERRKERIKKQEVDGEPTASVGDEEKKSLERKKKPKPKQRSSSCPGDGRVVDHGVLPRSRSQPRMSKELRSGGFDWSTSKNEEIRVWLKRKNRLFRRQRAEERKKEKMKKKEEEQKKKEHEELYADSSERVNEWLKLKKKQDHLSRKRQKEEQIKAIQLKDTVMVIGRKMTYEPVLTDTQINTLEMQQESALRTDQTQETILKPEPLLKQREKQRQLLLGSGQKQPIKPNKTLNLSHSSKENERLELLSRHTANQTQQDANAIEEVILQNVATANYLPSAGKSSGLVKTPIRRGVRNEPVVLPRQSLSPSKVTIPTGNVRASTESENVKKRMTFDDWLQRKKAEDERKRLEEQMAKEQRKNLEELSRSVEIKKIYLTPEKKGMRNESAENVSKKVPRLKSALKQPKQPQVYLEQESATNPQQEESLENKPSETDGGTIEGTSDVSQLVAEASENFTRSSSLKGARSNQSGNNLAGDMVTDKVPNPYIVGGSSIPATVLRAKSPKPKVAVRPTLRSVKYQQGSWDRFSNYLWDQVNEGEGGELTSSRDKQRQEPIGAETDKIKANFEQKAVKQDEKVEASAEEYVSPDSRMNMNLELNRGEDIEGEMSDVPYRGNQENWHLQELEARGRQHSELDELLNKSRNSKMPCQAKEIDDDCDASDMRHCREINEKEESQLVTRDENSIRTAEADGGFGMSSANKNIRTIFDAEDEETEAELEDETEAELKLETRAETRAEILMESNSKRYGQRGGTKKDEKHGIMQPLRTSSGNHVHFSDSEAEVMSDLEVLGSDSSNNAD